MSPDLLTLQQALRGRYSIIRELGRGGMGVVALARDVALDRLVAIKLLPPALADRPEARTRFLREARTVAGVAHPHIVPIHLVEEQQGVVCFVMGFVDGETLGERVRRVGPLPPGEVMRVVQEVAWALAHAHAKGIVHRDVKPDNILLERATGRALVTDFGIADLLAGHGTHDGIVAGTPQYVSPEVARGEPAGARSDLYSLGVTAWVAATGRLPFPAASAAGQLLAHAQTPAPSLAEAAPRLPIRFARAVDRALRKAPHERWPDLDAFAAEIDASRARITQVPAPVRAFLREWDGVGGEVATAATASAVALVEAGALFVTRAFVGGGVGFTASILQWILVLIAVLTAGLAKARMVQLAGHARVMLREGYGHDRLAAAQTTERADREEERAAVAGDRTMRRDGWTLIGGLAIGTAAAFALAFSDMAAWASLIGSAGAVVLPTLGLRTAWRLRMGDRESPWDRMLRGRLGRALFRFAGAGLDRPAGASALEGPEPTAVALGHAARDLYRALPAAVRATIPDVPNLIDALERAALTHRDGGDDPARAARFTAAVSALETLRIDLLRAQVDALPTTDLTTQIARIRELERDLDHRREAEREVEALLARREAGMSG